jgi:hypothetical protein
MSGGYSFKPRPPARRQLVRALGYGLLNFGFALETAMKARTPVHGAFRSFVPGAKPIGGTLRRSEHTAAYVDGERISPRATDDNDRPLPDYVPGTGAIVFVGTNSGYGLWVARGTSKMAARPFDQEALAEVGPRAGALVAAGARKALGQ